MAGPLISRTQTDFSGGENPVTSPHALKPNQSQQCINLLLDEHGALRVRDGTLLQGTAAPNTNPMTKLYDLALVNGTTYQLAILKGAAQNTLYNRATWAALGVFTGNYSLPDIKTFTNQAMIAAGNSEVLRYSDGTNLAALAGAPNGAHIAVHLNYLWAWNTAAATGATSGPSSLQSSDLNNPNSWAVGSQTFISKDDGQTGQGLALFTIAESGISPTATMIAWKDFSGYEVSGVFGSTSFTVQKIKSDMGNVAPRTSQFVSGFGLIRLSHRGFALYDGVSDTLISEEVRPRIFGRDIYTGVDWTNVNLSYATQVANPPLYICACPLTGGGGALSRVFVYDLVRRAWTICTLARSVATLELILNANVLPVVMGGDYSGGYVRRYFAGDTDDDGTAIAWSVATRPVTVGSQLNRLYIRRLLMSLYGMTVGNTITSTFYWGSNIYSQSKDIPSVAATVVQAGYGQGGYGTSPYGDPTAAAGNTELTMDFGIQNGVIANNLYALISGSGPGKIRGLSWQVRTKSLTRSVSSPSQV